MSSPVIWGPNGLAINLENGLLLGNGQAITANGPKNYIGNGNFENGQVAPWALGTIGTLTNGLPTGTPTFGSGAAGTLSIATVTTGQLSGAASLSLVSSAATTVGNMLASGALPIDPSDQAKVLGFKFSYKAVSGTFNMSGTSANSFGVAVWDVTNSAWLGVAGAFNIVQGSGVGVSTGTFQTNVTTASIQFIVYAVNATTGAVTLYLDDFFVGPQVTSIAPTMSDWVAYTPVFTNFGTVASSNFKSRRVGDSLEVVGYFTAGTTGGGALSIGLGFNGASGNVVVDTTKVNTNSVVGPAAINTASTTYFGAAILSPGSNLSSVGFSVQSSTANELSPATGGPVPNGAAISVAFTVPILGWSSNTVSSADTDTRFIGAVLSGLPTGTVNNSFNNAVFPTVTSDTLAGYSTSTGIYTVGVTGNYDIVGMLGITATWAVGNSCEAGIYINGSLITAGLARAWAATTTILNPIVSLLGYPLKAGDQVILRGTATGTTPTYAAGDNFNSFSISRRSGPAVVQATESVNMRYYGSSSTISGTLSTVMFSTKAWDTHNAYSISTGLYTAPVSGKYQVNCSIAASATLVLNSTLDIQMQQAGSGTQVSEQTVYAGGAQTAIDGTIGDIFYLQAGDTVKVQVSNSGSAPAIVASNSKNWVSIARVGN